MRLRTLRFVILTVLLLSGSAAVAQQAGRPCAGDIKTCAPAFSLAKAGSRPA